MFFASRSFARQTFGGEPRGARRVEHTARHKVPFSLLKFFKREALSALESVGAIRKEGEPNREGTLYRVLVPDEIEACRKFRTERLQGEKKPEVLEKDVDYYNVRENRMKVNVTNTSVATVGTIDTIYGLS